MNIVEILKQIAIAVEHKEDNLFSYPVEKQKDYLKKLSDPIDDIERSYYQYKCQKVMRSKIPFYISNMISAILVVVYVIKSKYNRCIWVARSQAVFLHDGKNFSIVPNSVRLKYKDIMLSDGNEYTLINQDVKYIVKVWKRHPLAFEFLLKNIIKIARYRALVSQYNPNAIIVCTEYSYTSSLLTDWCAHNNIEHINVMHGEKLYYIRDSFFRFHRCYVWDEYYKRLFVELRADAEQFVVEVPNSILFNEKQSYAKEMDYTYYLMDEDKVVLEAISTNLKLLKNKGYSIAVRPHPRYSNVQLVNELFGDIALIEACQEISIEESVLRTRNAISLYSTVLNQAYHNGVRIVIDDVSDKIKYDKLHELKYRLIYVDEKKLLSEIL